MTHADPLTDMHEAVARLVQFFEQLQPDDLSRMGVYYAPQARFKDPFNEVCGVPAIAEVFAHMFATLEQPRFVVTRQLVQGDQAFLAWEFHFRLRRWRARADQCIHGASLLSMDAQGQVVSHRDYWDAAEELYEKLPLIGSLMRWLRRAGSATTAASQADRSRA